jgi:hypothetical protein
LTLSFRAFQNCNKAKKTKLTFSTLIYIDFNYYCYQLPPRLRLKSIGAQEEVQSLQYLVPGTWYRYGGKGVVVFVFRPKSLCNFGNFGEERGDSKLVVLVN